MVDPKTFSTKFFEAYYKMKLSLLKMTSVIPSLFLGFCWGCSLSAALLDFFVCPTCVSRASPPASANKWNFMWCLIRKPPVTGVFCFWTQGSICRRFSGKERCVFSILMCWCLVCSEGRDRASAALGDELERTKQGVCGTNGAELIKKKKILPGQ